MTQKSITLNPSESGRVSFSFIPTEARIHAVSINGLTGSFEALTELASLQGKMRDSITGKGIKNVRVELAGVGYALTDIAGDYIIMDIPPGTYELSVTHPDYETPVLGSRTFVAGEKKYLSLRLVPLAPTTAILWGWVKDIETREPIAGARITVVGFSSSISGRYGQYKVEGIPPGTYTVNVTHADYRTYTVVITLRAGEREEHTVYLTPKVAPPPVGPATFKGLITTNLGAALRDALVELVGVGSDVTDIGGRFEITDIPPGVTYTLSVTHPDYIEHIDTLVFGEGEIREVMIMLEPILLPPVGPATLYGEVVDATNLYLGIEGAIVNIIGVTSVVTGSGGRYEIIDILSGTYGVEVSHPDYRTRSATITLEPGQRRHAMFPLIPLWLEPL